MTSHVTSWGIDVASFNGVLKLLKTDPNHDNMVILTFIADGAGAGSGTKDIIPKPL